MPQYTPPTVLVNTWLQLISLNAEKEAIRHAKKMLEQNFGSVDLAITYLQQSQGHKVKSDDRH